MLYESPAELERKKWRTLPEVVKYVCHVTCCDVEIARQNIRKALENGALNPLKWENPDKIPTLAGSLKSSQDETPAGRHAHWADARVDWQDGTVLDDFDYFPDALAMARHKKLLILNQSVEHIWGTATGSEILPNRQARRAATPMDRVDYETRIKDFKEKHGYAPSRADDERWAGERNLARDSVRDLRTSTLSDDDRRGGRRKSK